MSQTHPVIRVENLKKAFVTGQSGFFGHGGNQIHAVDEVSFTIQKGEILALVGESGCGKSTLALTLMGLEQPTAGNIWFNGDDISHANKRAMKALRRQIQMIFQDPYESLNPVMTIGEIVAEPLVVHSIVKSRPDREAKVKDALESAGLKPAGQFIHRYPHELSGGQRQRVIIAGALILEPSLLLADEPVSMLDVSIRAEILNLLAELRQSRGISMLYITHDLSTVAYIADRIAVMYLGRIVEIGTAKDILQNPQHPYTRALLSVVPVPNPRLRKTNIILEGETPDPVNLPSYCRFYSRCPIAEKQCQQVDPRLESVTAGHDVACIRV